MKKQLKKIWNVILAIWSMYAICTMYYMSLVNMSKDRSSALILLGGSCLIYLLFVVRDRRNKD